MPYRKWQRQADASLQQRLQRDFGQTTREVLEGTWDKLPKEPDPDTIPFWKGIFGRQSEEVDLQLPPPAEIKWGLMSPVIKSEIRDNLVGVSGCPGPDGLTWSELKKTPNNVLARLYNL